MTLIRAFRKFWAMWFVLFLWSFGSIVCIGAVAHLDQVFPEGEYDSVIFDLTLNISQGVMEIGTGLLYGLLISLAVYFLVWPVIKQYRKRGEKKNES